MRPPTASSGSADATIFSNPEDLVEHEEQVQDQLKRFTSEIEEGEASEIQNQLGRFEGLKDPALEEAVALPGGSVFAWVYTQYGEPVEAPDEPSEEAEEQTGVYSHIFPNGVAGLTPCASRASRTMKIPR